MFKKTILAAAGVALLVAAPTVALADDAPTDPTVETVQEVVQETIPDPTPIEEAPAPVDEQTPVTEEEPPAPPVTEEPPTTEEPPVAVEEPPVVEEQWKTLRWTLPNGGTPDNVTWDQPVFDASAIPCGESVWVQVDTYPYTTDADKARTDALDDDGILTYGEDHGWAYSWTFEQYQAPACPVVVPPTPTVAITAVCGAVDVLLTNPQAEGTIGQTAAFVVELDGEFSNAYTVAADGQETIHLTFDEDSGDHTIEVFQAGISEWKSIGFATITSDCMIPEEPTTPTTPEEPVVDVPTTDTTIAPAVARAAVTDVPTTLAETGQNTGALWMGGAVALALAVVGSGLALLARRPVPVRGRTTLER